MEGGLLAKMKMKSLHLRGEGELQESCSFLFLHIYELFQIIVSHILKSIKWLTKPSKKFVSSFLYDHREAQSSK